MSTSGDPTLPAVAAVDRLATACYTGDLPSAVAAVADGASVNSLGYSAGMGMERPLLAAVYQQHFDVVVWLLSHGADPNGDEIMYFGTRSSTAGILQLLIDAGGDVNRAVGVSSVEDCPLFQAVHSGCEGKMRVLLAQPSLDLNINDEGITPEQAGRTGGRPALADMIAREVRAVSVLDCGEEGFR